MPPTEQDRALAARLAAEVYAKREARAGFGPQWDDVSGEASDRAIGCVLAGMAASRSRSRDAARLALQAVRKAFRDCAIGGDVVDDMLAVCDRYLAETYPPVVPPVVLCTACLQVGADPVTGQHATWGTCIAALGVALAASYTEGK